MEYAVTNSFDADIEHHTIQIPANTIPNVPLQLKKKLFVLSRLTRFCIFSFTYCNAIRTLIPDSTTIGNKQ